MTRQYRAAAGVIAYVSTEPCWWNIAYVIFMGYGTGQRDVTWEDLTRARIGCMICGSNCHHTLHQYRTSRSTRLGDTLYQYRASRITLGGIAVYATSVLDIAKHTLGG
eukprot:371788-Rhodomonas_salina.1